MDIFVDFVEKGAMAVKNLGRDGDILGGEFFGGRQIGKECGGGDTGNCKQANE